MDIDSFIIGTSFGAVTVLAAFWYLLFMFHKTASEYKKDAELAIRRAARAETRLKVYEQHED